MTWCNELWATPRVVGSCVEKPNHLVLWNTVCSPPRLCDMYVIIQELIYSLYVRLQSSWYAQYTCSNRFQIMFVCQINDPSCGFHDFTKRSPLPHGLTPRTAGVLCWNSEGSGPSHCRHLIIFVLRAIMLKQVLRV